MLSLITGTFPWLNPCEHIQIIVQFKQSFEHSRCFSVLRNLMYFFLKFFVIILVYLSGKEVRGVPL